MACTDQVPFLKKTAVEHIWVEKKTLPPHLAAIPKIRQLPIEVPTFLSSHWADQERSFQAAGDEFRQDLTQLRQSQLVKRMEWSRKDQGVLSGNLTWSGELSDSGDGILVSCEVQASCTEGISIG